MILVTVGTHNQPFDRLVASMDDLAEKLNEQVVIQRGVSSYLPRQAESFPFTTGSQMADLMGTARVVVTHAGAGTIILGLRGRRPLVVVPRLERFGEANNDHQLELAQVLKEMQKAVVVDHPTPAALHEAIQLAGRSVRTPTGAAVLVGALKQQLCQWERSSGRQTVGEWRS